MAKGQLLVRDRLRLLFDDQPDFEDGLLARAPRMACRATPW